VVDALLLPGGLRRAIAFQSQVDRDNRRLRREVPSAPPRFPQRVVECGRSVRRVRTSAKASSSSERSSRSSFRSSWLSRRDFAGSLECTESLIFQSPLLMVTHRVERCGRMARRDFWVEVIRTVNDHPSVNSRLRAQTPRRAGPEGRQSGLVDLPTASGHE